MNEEEERIKLEAVKEMEMQLHEQFASNYNNGFSTTVTLFCTLLAVLYGYGYVFLHSSICYMSTPECFYHECCKIYTLDALIYVTIAANIVLTIMKYICLSQGINLRLEQFIVHAIRCKYYGVDPTLLDRPRIFPKNYKPFGKNGDDVVVGMYGMFIKIICSLQILVMIGCLYKILWNIIVKNNCSFNPNAFFEWIFLIVVSAFCCIQYHRKKEEFKKKYKNRSMEYMLDISSDNK